MKIGALEYTDNIFLPTDLETVKQYCIKLISLTCIA